MTWRTEKTRSGEDLVWSGVETGIAPSPHKGTANIQNANIATETGEVMASYGRTNQAQVAIPSGNLTPDGATLFDAPAALKAGTWIKVTASSVTSITATTGATSASADYLVVGGGGGGGGAIDGASGGGGAGGMLTGSTSLSAGTYTITIGAGGAGRTSGVTGNSGSDSSISGGVATATGGGGGGGVITGNGGNGGSGGGGGARLGVVTGNGGTGTGGQGSNGGNSRGTATVAGGGGGGASAAGANASSSGVGTAGGAGTASSITGSSVTYAGGGGGGGATTNGAGGAGGGGSAQQNANGLNGTDGLGGGGGGCSDNSGGNFYQGGDGGNGVVVVSYDTGTMYAVGGSMYQSGTKTIHVFNMPDGWTSSTYTDQLVVVWVNPGGLYYVSYKDTNNKIKLSAKYDPYAANALTHGTTGSVTFSTVATPDGGVAKAVEKYTSATATEYRYYILDRNEYVWVYDTAVYDASLLASGVGTTWMMPSPVHYATLSGDMTGMAVLNGFLMVVSNSYIFAKPTTNLGNAFIPLADVYLNEPFPTHKNFAYTGSQGKMYYCDGNYIGEIFPTTSLITSIANIQSFGSYTASGNNGTLTSVISGSIPYSSDDVSQRIPAVFFTDEYGTLPTAITANTVYYIRYSPAIKQFQVYDSETGGSQTDISTGAAGNQYFNTFYPIGITTGYNGDDITFTWSSQRLNLPTYETAQCMVEIGNTLLIGCNGSTLYPWNQVDATPSDIIALPESDVKTMVNANNTAYVFAGNKGNVYVSNVSVAALAGKIPDYTAGVPGTPLTYIEPRFTWGDSMYVRGRVYCSILDQTSTKAGNCGGVWSFIPSENIDPNQALGMALRLENQNSYGDYDGYATILIPNEEQDAISPQYWSSWQDSYTPGTSTFGIDYTNTVPVVTYVIETDLLPSGTSLAKTTFSQVEYKMASPLASGDSVQLYYRLNATDAWTTCGTLKEETTNRISGYWNVNFQKTQWTQLRAVATTTGTTASSFDRIVELRLR